jgi:hypothetical protein
MKRTNKFEGQIYKLIERAGHVPYIASFDITAHTCIIDKYTLHIAFAITYGGKVMVTLCYERPGQIIYHHTRTLNEVLTGKSENDFGHDVFPAQFERFLAQYGLSKGKYQDLVEEAKFQLGDILNDDEARVNSI